MNGNPWRDEAIRHSSDWLDTDDEWNEAAVEARFFGDKRVRRHFADLLWIDALLANLASQTEDSKEARIRRVMAAVTTSTLTQSKSRLKHRLYSVLALAACVTVACSLFWWQSSRESRANDVLLEIGQVSLDHTDRVYHIRRGVTGLGGPREPQGKLYLRGVDGFVVVCGEAALGRSGDEFWVVAPDLPVVLSSDFSWIAADWVSEVRELGLLKDLALESRHVPLMQLSTVVELLQHEYDVVVSRSLPNGGVRLDELIGTRRQTQSELPSTIHLWFDAESKIIHRAELSWSPAQGEREAHSVSLELAPDEDVPSGWYAHDAHHASSRPVRRVGASTSPRE